MGCLFPFSWLPRIKSDSVAVNCLAQMFSLLVHMPYVVSLYKFSPLGLRILGPASPQPKPSKRLPAGGVLSAELHARWVAFLSDHHSDQMEMVVSSCVERTRRGGVVSATSFGHRQVLSLPQSSCGEPCPGVSSVVQGHMTESVNGLHRASWPQHPSSFCFASDCLLTDPIEELARSIKTGRISNELKLEGSLFLLTAWAVFSKHYLSSGSRQRVYYILPKFIHECD